MISGNQGKNFAAAHWDWLAALGGVAVLAISVAFNFVLAEDPAGEDGSAPGSKKPAPVAQIGLDALDADLESAKEPARLAEIPGDKRSFLASGLRVFCAPGDPAAGKSCGLPIPFGLEKCPICGVAQKKEETPTFDTDADGMPDDYEKKHGLDPNDAGDATADADGDGFTNIEEFEAGTSPSDPASHPDYIDSLKLELPLKQTYTDLVFTGANKTPSGLKLGFKDPKRSNDYDRGIYSVYAGSPIGKSGFTVKSYEQKSRKVKLVGGGMEKTEDVSEAVVQRDRDKKLVRLVINARKTPTDVQAKIVFERGGRKEFLVVPGQEFEVNGQKFTVSTIEKTAHGARVAIEDAKTGKKRTVEALEQ